MGGGGGVGWEGGRLVLFGWFGCCIFFWCFFLRFGVDFMFCGLRSILDERFEEERVK